ncbi:hypothetical protein JOEDIRT_105 [Mycobacterium phage JoeDirt]|uniref:Uncharacterized protein n=1 Tax=Mycobacterium phage JoeDirt TaxID=2920882 RepID=G1BQN2_9CAUD|nr:hypothetical protein FGG55_gp126 [Mycobacterium phage JoeDirt]AEK07130.1 hypothetical protein JOEDIRT_105 [Mycobacterium phage JoeDirt]
MTEVDPIWAAKQELGVIQKLDEREWPKVPAPAPVEVDDDKPKRGRPKAPEVDES